MKIRARKKAEEELSRVNRELRAITECGKAIVKATDEQTLLNDVCHIICDVAGYRMAWVGIIQHDTVKSVKPVAWGGVEDGYLTNANITWADTERGRGPTGTAARTGKTYFFQDFEKEPAAEPWRDAALSRGYRSSIAIPLYNSMGHVFGVFTLYAPEPNGFTPVEVGLLEGLAGDLAFGINALRIRTERDRAVEALQKNEEKFRLIATRTPDHILMQDSELRYVLVVNPQLGLTQEDMIGKTDYDILAEDDADKITEIKRRVLTGGNAESVSTSAAARDGSRQYFEGTYVPTFDINGRADGILGYFRNVTERMKMEESLRQTRDYLDSLFNYANAPIIVWDPDLRITRFNHAFEHLTGLTADQALGRKIDILFPDDSRDSSMKHIIDATAGQRWEVVEIPIVHTDGTIRILLWNSAIHLCTGRQDGGSYHGPGPGYHGAQEGGTGQR